VFFGVAAVGWLMNAVADGTILSWAVAVIWLVMESFYVAQLIRS
jgi:hypothetical protein